MTTTYTARNGSVRGGIVEREKALEVALLQIEKQFGKGSVMRMSGDGPVLPIEFISTGSLALDLALGIGGVPRGRVIEIYGPEASGKTTVGLHIIAEAQRAGGIAAFIDAEHALDVTYARNLGVDTDAMLVSQPDTGEQALEIADMLVRSGAIDVIVVDSVAALVPRAEIEGEMGDSHVGLQARLMSQALRKLSGSISKSRTTAVKKSVCCSAACTTTPGSPWPTAPRRRSARSSTSTYRSRSSPTTPRSARWSPRRSSTGSTTAPPTSSCSSPSPTLAATAARRSPARRTTRSAPRAAGARPRSWPSATG